MILIGKIIKGSPLKIVNNDINKTNNNENQTYSQNYKKLKTISVPYLFIETPIKQFRKDVIKLNG